MNVDLAVSSLFQEGEYVNCDVLGAAGKSVVSLYFKPKLFWDETDFMNQVSAQDVKVMEILFKNPSVSEVILWAQTDMTDAKGNSSTDNVVRIKFTKGNAADINWPKFKEMVSYDYKKLISVADEYYINPGILKNLK